MIHIFTLNWNGEHLLERLYPSLINSLDNIEFKWWIKENGSIDNSKNLNQIWNNSDVQILDWKHNNDSYSKGNNILFEISKPTNNDLILLLNNDIVFNDNKSIHNMIKIMEDETVGQVGAKLNYINDKTIIQHAGVLFHPATGTPINYKAGIKETNRDRENRQFPMVTAALTLIRANLWSTVGGFDEKYHFMFEDCDLSLKIQQTGKKVIYCGNTNILHEESFSLKKNPRHKLFFNQNIKIFLDKWNQVIDKSLFQKYEQNSEFLIYKGYGQK